MTTGISGRGTRRVAGAAALFGALLAAGACGGDGGTDPTPTPVTYDLLYLDGAPLPETIASGMGFAEELVSGKLVLSGGEAMVVHDREVSTSAGTTTPSDTVRWTTQRSGEKLILTRTGAAGVVKDTILVDSSISTDLYLFWPTTIVGQRGSRTGELTYIKHQ